MRVSDWNQVEKIEGEWAQYRGRTVGLLRKYLRMSVETGRLPSLLGREFFRTAVTSYTTHTFEDAVIFVLDMERILDWLEREEQALIVRVVFQEYTYDEAAGLLAIPRRSFVRRFAGALDCLSQLLLECRMLDRSRQSLSSTTVKLLSRPEELPAKIPVSGVRSFVNAQTSLPPKFCQVSKIAKIPVIA